MTTRAHPEHDLSLSQIIFTLNQELKHATCSQSPYVTEATTDSLASSRERCADLFCSFTFDEVCQLDKDTSAALATVREWRNSFLPVNRIALDVLSLVPIHLSSNDDRLRASSVCRHWRRTFLQRAELWSELSLSKGDAYTRTFLERAKGSMLDVIAGGRIRAGTMDLLSSHTKQIRRLEFTHDSWANIKRFLQVNSGPLPLLHTLTVDGTVGNRLEEPDSMDPSQPPLLSNAINLKAFHFHSDLYRPPFISHFVFPSLRHVSFDLLATRHGNFRPSQLLNFLAASPMLRTVHIKIIGRMSLNGIPEDRVIVLPSLETFTMVSTDSRGGAEFATHISCPSARSMSLMHKTRVGDAVMVEIFPGTAYWDTFVRQYTRSPVEDVTIEMKVHEILITTTLTLQSSDGTVLSLGSEVTSSMGLVLSPDVQDGILVQAARAIQDHPQVANVRRLRICHNFRLSVPVEDSLIANEVGTLFGTVGALDELTIYRSDLRPYLLFFLGPPERRARRPVAFPQIKEFVISHPVKFTEDKGMAIVELAKLQHERGIPFERVVVRRESMPEGMEEGLRLWVGSVEFCYDELREVDGYTG